MDARDEVANGQQMRQVLNFWGKSREPELYCFHSRANFENLAKNLCFSFLPKFCDFIIQQSRKRRFIYPWNSLHLNFFIQYKRFGLFLTQLIGFIQPDFSAQREPLLLDVWIDFQRSISFWLCTSLCRAKTLGQAHRLC